MNKEQIESLADFIDSAYFKKDEELSEVIADFLSKNPLEPVIVGLTDEQFFSLAKDVFGHCYNPKLEELFVDFKSWQKTQPFAQPCVCGLSECLQDAEQVDKLVFQRPTQPAPLVEVGQVWKHIATGNDYIVDVVGEMKYEVTNGALWLESVTYHSLKSSKFYTRKMSDYLGKFARVL